MLTNVLATLDAHYPHGARTILSLENPLGRFRRLPVVKATAAAPGWCMFTADHCSLASTLDTDPVFPKKPTTWLCKNIPPQSEPPPRCEMMPGRLQSKMASIDAACPQEIVAHKLRESCAQCLRLEDHF